MYFFFCGGKTEFSSAIYIVFFASHDPSEIIILIICIIDVENCAVCAF